MLDKQLEEYNRDGVCKLENLFSESEISEINAEIEKFIAEHAKSLGGRQINYAGKEINSIHHLTPDPSNFFGRLLHSRKLMDAARVFLGDDAKPRATELFAKPAKVGLPSPWHQDDAYWCVDNHNGLTFWVALDPCDPGNGAVEFFKGSHLLGLVTHGDSRAPGSSQTVAAPEILKSLEKNKISFSLNPGDCTVHHALTIHGSPANTSDRRRRGIIFQYIGASSQFDKARLALYEKSLKRQIEDRQKGKG